MSMYKVAVERSLLRDVQMLHLPTVPIAVHVKGELSAAAAGVVDVEVVMSKEQPGSGRGFCFVEFYNHSAAAHAKTLLGSENFQ